MRVWLNNPVLGVRHDIRIAKGQLASGVLRPYGNVRSDGSVKLL